MTAGDSYNLPIFKNTKKLILNALKRVFKKEKQLVDPDLWKVTYQALEAGINKGIAQVQYNKPNFKFTKQLRESAALFAAQKSWAQAKQLAEIASSKDGHQITWKEFLEQARPIIGDYNERWLKTEFNTAISAARQASLWQEYEDSADLYPNLRYMASRAATPREEHKPYYGIVRPINDDFWVHHLPPSAWNCLCGVEQTDDEVTPLPENGPKPVKGLDNNAGITGKLFSESHPYAEAVNSHKIAKPVQQESLLLKKQYDYETLHKEPDFKSGFKDAEQFKALYPALDQEEITTIRMYTGSIYFDLNRIKRGELQPWQYMTAFSDVLQTALNTAPTYAGQTFRTTTLPQSVIDTYAAHHKDGTPAIHNYFTSTSKVESVGFNGNVRFDIEGKSGIDVERLSHYPDEKEVLFNAGAAFKVVGIVESNGITYISLEEL